MYTEDNKIPNMTIAFAALNVIKYDINLKNKYSIYDVIGALIKNNFDGSVNAGSTIRMPQFSLVNAGFTILNKYEIGINAILTKMKKTYLFLILLLFVILLKTFKAFSLNLENDSVINIRRIIKLQIKDIKEGGKLYTLQNK